LTTTKQGKNSEIKKMNMKVAGTIGNFLKKKVPIETNDSPGKDEKDDLTVD
jgi:hypothetical protein